MLERTLRYAEGAEDHGYSQRLARRWEETGREPATRCLARWYRARALYAMGRYESALAAFNAEGCGAETSPDHAHYAGLAAMRLKRWDEAAVAFSHAGPDHRGGISKSAAEAARTGPSLRFRSPAAATALAAILPGAGYAYADSSGSAVAALLTVGALSWASWTSFRSGNQGVGVVAGALAFSWHLGGIQGAPRAVGRRNDLLMDRTVRPFEY